MHIFECKSPEETLYNKITPYATFIQPRTYNEIAFSVEAQNFFLNTLNANGTKKKIYSLLNDELTARDWYCLFEKKPLLINFSSK